MWTLQTGKVESSMMTVGPNLSKLSRYWLPVLAWAAAIFTGSSDVLSANNTSRFLEPMIHWVVPWLQAETVEAVMAVIRKCGHVTEYAILAILCWRAFYQPVRGEWRPWRWREAGLALLAAVCYAASDEFHQSFVPSRTASLWDVLIDTCGAVTALAIVWAWRVRQAQCVSPKQQAMADALPRHPPQ